MATFRRFRPDDVNKFSKCNLDPLTETYDLTFYMQYHCKWPSLFQVCEDSDGNIIGYSEWLQRRFSSRGHHGLFTANHYANYIVMGKVESSPEAYKFSEHYLPWHAHITALTVAPEARRLGIGRILTEQLEAAANNCDAWFMDLFVRRSNQEAIEFYKSMGYSVYRVVEGYYGDNTSDPTLNQEDAFDMRKSMKRDVEGQHVRLDGIDHIVSPENVW
jgi:N-terminal acetyltransferase B complex catalytic subunit